MSDDGAQGGGVNVMARRYREDLGYRQRDEAPGGGPDIFFRKESEEPSRKRRVYPCATWRINGQLFEGRWRHRERCGQYGKQQESSCYEEMVMLEAPGELPPGGDQQGSSA